ncbi:MAG: D-alanyl-D-alanine endopeptidase [Rhodocyclaceae bacterium]|jgi:D-alanyl-D-alanine endopeptidase (penicillin-binding protein 7)|nr:D-alanyl-D-alanine endopeptidase [Rhodocyclaceae bacterium]
MAKNIVSLICALCVTVGFSGVAPDVFASSTPKRVAAANKKVVKQKFAVKRAKAKSGSVRKPAAVARSADKGFLVSQDGTLQLQSSAVFVQDQASGDVLVDKNSSAVLPIASITKLMTAMVALDATPDLQETLTIGSDDIDLLKGTGSRLNVGTRLSREELLRLALMSSENRAASALSRHYPGGKAAFVTAMNRKAEMLGLGDTHFLDPTGLTAANVSSPRDLARMVNAAYQYPLIREFSTTPGDVVRVSGREMQFNNTNSLVKNPTWEIGLSKTGYIAEAGKCLVMQAYLNSKPVVIVLLDSWGKATRIGDANRIKRWMEAAGFASSANSARPG